MTCSATRRHAPLVAVAVLTAGLVSCMQAAEGQEETVSAGLKVVSLSAKPHLVSGGDVLLRVDVPEDVALSNVSVRVNGSDVTEAFHPVPDAHGLLGLVDGLLDGNNDVVVEVEGQRPATRLALTNYPISGPMISGPHEEPFFCGTEGFTLVTGETLGPPLDDDCSVETRVDYVYWSTGGEFMPLSDWSDGLPEDVAETTTTGGDTVPFVVRVQTGTINRAIYESAMLHDPRGPAQDLWTRSPGWNGRLVYTHGGGCRSGWYQQGARTGGVLREELLQDGYAVTSASLNVFGQNCNDVVASETHMMVKERFVESYGPPMFTIGTGGSGGSYQSHQTADNYPGVFDGIIVSSSFPDVISATIFTLADARLLHNYFTNVAPGTFTEEEQRAVAGFGQWGSLPNLSRGAARIDPIFDEGSPLEEQGGELGSLVPETERYDPVSNPTGARATVYDHMINIFGIDPDTGFAGRPLDNVGVQYGLGALNAREITKAHFLDLNERIGGFDADANHVAERHAANERAARIARQTGRILNGGGGLATTPVIDYRSYTDARENGDIHMKVHQHSTRARMAHANGQADNHVMLVQGRWGFTSDRPDLRTVFDQMDRWLTNVASDTSHADLSGTVVRAKPPELVDACWDNRVEPRKKIEETQTFDGPGVCNELYAAFPTARGVAGAPLVNDIVKCQLEPIRLDDYAVTFTEQERERLDQIFAEGVCDWSKPGVYRGDYQGTWLSFGPSPVNLVR